MSRINQDKEIWKDIPDFEGLYQVSNKGRVKSFWFWSNCTNQRHYREKILKPKYAKDKYARVELWKGGEHKTYLVHRLVLCAFTGKTYEYEMTVNHKDGNRFNNSVENLEWLSQADNIRHAFATGLLPYPLIDIIDKETDEVVFTGSKAKGGLYIGCSNGYLSAKMSKGIYENNKYKWKYHEK